MAVVEVAQFRPLGVGAEPTTAPVSEGVDRRKQPCVLANVIKLRKRTLNVILSALSSGTISLFVIVRLNNFYFVYQTIKLTSEIKRDILLSKGVGAMKISVGMS